MQNGHYMTGDGNHHRMVEVDMMGNTIHNWDMLERGYTMHHAISQDKQGNILATVSKTSAKIANGKDVRINDFIIMMDPEKGEILQEWDLVHMLDSARYGMTDYDLTSDPFIWLQLVIKESLSLIKLEVLSGLYRLMGIGEINT